MPEETVSAEREGREPEVARLHKWETLAGGVTRLPVPGGWIYADAFTEERVFVPAPPRLVAFVADDLIDDDDPEKGSEEFVVYVNSAAVCGLKPTRDGEHCWLEYHPTWCVAPTQYSYEQRNAALCVKGTPAEVAAKLGLEVIR